MGTVHKFKRPPKNQKQFQGYKPGSPGGVHGAKPKRRPLRGWQRSAIAWSGLILLAIAFWAIPTLLGKL
jgi:hypothetical protein